MTEYKLWLRLQWRVTNGYRKNVLPSVAFGCSTVGEVLGSKSGGLGARKEKLKCSRWVDASAVSQNCYNSNSLRSLFLNRLNKHTTKLFFCGHGYRWEIASKAPFLYLWSQDIFNLSFDSINKYIFILRDNNEKEMRALTEAKTAVHNKH